jgi:hypothetical protein
MPKKKPTAPTVIPEYVDGATMAAMLGVSTDQLKNWRLGREGRPATLKEGVHWVRLGPKATRYNVAMMRDYMATRHAPKLHAKAIEAFLRALPSSKAVE